MEGQWMGMCVEGREVRCCGSELLRNLVVDGASAALGVVCL
jgi:hypothetical protein